VVSSIREDEVGRTGSWLLVVAVGVLAAAAAVDALRPGESVDPPAPTTTATEATPDDARDVERRAAADELEAAGIDGTLLWTDERCRLHALALPDLAPVAAGEGWTCRYAGPRDGWVSYAAELRSPDGGRVARCRDGVVEVFSGAGRLAAERVRFRGCAPAWRPDGTLTFVRDGEVVALAPCARDPECVRALLSRRDLRAALGRDPWAFTRPFVREVAWLRRGAFAVLVRDAVQNLDVIAVFRRGRLVEAPPFAYGRLSALRASPYGSYVAARVGESGLILLDSRGRFEATGLRSGRAVTWSPDETWTAMATEDGVFVFETGERALQLIRIPVRAVDVAWRLASRS
jgi:hypothetical protein